MGFHQLPGEQDVARPKSSYNSFKVQKPEENHEEEARQICTAELFTSHLAWILKKKKSIPWKNEKSGVMLWIKETGVLLESKLLLPPQSYNGHLGDSWDIWI